jgi:hypothetical protein
MASLLTAFTSGSPLMSFLTRASGSTWAGGAVARARGVGSPRRGQARARLGSASSMQSRHPHEGKRAPAHQAALLVLAARRRRDLGLCVLVVYRHLQLRLGCHLPSLSSTPKGTES